MLFAVLLFLSLISYTAKDELNTKITLSELSSIFSSDSMIRIKADTTYNWLGLLGAVISNILINWTVGYLIIFFPIFLFVWGLNIFKENELSEKLIRSTIIYLLFSILLCSFIGSLRNFTSLSDIPKEWTGAVGMFTATIFAKLIGSIGAFLIFLVLMVVVLIFGTNIKWSPIITTSRKIAVLVKDKSVALFKFLFVKAKDFKEINKELLTDTPASEPEATASEDAPAEPPAPKEEATVAKATDFHVVKTSSSKPIRILQPKFHSESVATPQVAASESKPQESPSAKADSVAYEPAAAPLGLRNLDSKEEESVVIGVVSELEKSEPAGKIASQEDEDLEKVSTQSEPASKEYFKVEDKDIMPEIDDALLIKKDEITDKGIEKPIMPPKPVAVEIPSVPRSGRAPLVVHLEESEPEQELSLNTPLGVEIHDEQITYYPPTLDLLDTRAEESRVTDDELKMNARILQEKLETFKILIEDLTVTPGPVVTQYEFVPAAGIKISRIESLSDDLAMALKAKGIRIIAPIPGKGTIGVEIPNMHPSVVRFSHVVNTAKFYESRAILPLALGKTISGEVVITDLTKAPHLLIAGSTGSGKSVGINTIINSLLFKMSPSELKFVIIDPKKVELQQYSRLRYHYMAMSPDIDDAIITNPQDAVSILKSVVLEMENRYNILAKVGQRNIFDYNNKVKQGAYKNVKDFDHRQMPYIVVVIDELADLMLTASKEVEEPIIRLAQMARAIGIHLIIATQRPSVDVITGIIKANFPARIAYLVASKIDSRTILDASGAEQLLGNGDMLFLPSGSPKPTRIQNAFISTDEVDNVCNFIGKQDGYSKPYLLPSINDEKDSCNSIAAEDRDPLFEDAARLVIQHQQASVSLVQRRLKVGYARAGRIIDELEDAGIVGPNEGSKARLVLLDSEADLERIL